MNSGIYIITCIINNKIYIGRSKNWKLRLNKHKLILSKNCHVNEHLQNAYNKYGSENFTFELLEEYSEEFLPSMENWWCNILSSHDRNFGYNISPISPKNNSSLSQETKNKLRLLNTGKKASKITKKKMSLKSIGRKHSIESRKKISEYRLKNPLKPNLGKKLNKETIEKSISKRRKKILQYDLNMNFIKEWNSCTEAAKELKMSKGNINSCCKGKKFSTNGFRWSY